MSDKKFIIQIDEDFAIDYSDGRNWTLRHTYDSHDRDTKEPKRITADAGHCGTFRQALQRYQDKKLRDGLPNDLADVMAKLDAIHATIKRIQPPKEAERVLVTPAEAIRNQLNLT